MEELDLREEHGCPKGVEIGKISFTLSEDILGEKKVEFCDTKESAKKTPSAAIYDTITIRP